MHQLRLTAAFTEVLSRMLPTPDGASHVRPRLCLSRAVTKHLIRTPLYKFVFSSSGNFDLRNLRAKPLLGGTQHAAAKSPKL